MTGFQPVQSLFPTQGTSAAGILGGGTAAGGDGATDLFTQLLSGMVEADSVGSQSTGQGTAFLGTGQGASSATTSPFTPSTVPFATGKAGATGKNGIAPAGTTTGTAVTALMTGITANSPSALQAGTGWTQTHWSAATATTDAVTDGDGKDAATSQDGTATDTTMAALATAISTQQQQPLPTPAAAPQAASGATGQVAQDATKATGLADAKGVDATLAQTAATAAQPGTKAQTEGDGTVALAGMTPVEQPTAADATLAAQAAAALAAGQATTTPAKGNAAATAATTLAVADQKAAALATGAPATSARATPPVPSPTVPTAATAQAQKTQTDAAALAATTAAVAAGAADVKTGKADGVAVSGSGLKGGTPSKANAKGDTVKLPGVSVTASATDQKVGAADTADQTRQQTADSATDGNGSNGLLANTSGEGMIYADAHAAAAAPLTKVGDAAAAAAPMATLATGAGGNTAATATQTATATAQATLQTLLQQQQAGRTNTASNGLLATTENGLLPAAAETTGTSTSASDAALNASGFMGMVDGQHTFATGFAAQMAGTSQAARPPQYPPVLQQVTMGFQKAASNGMDSITVQLSPDDMGSIDVKLDFHKDGKVHASVTADNAKTLDLLQRNSDDLKNALQDAGLQTDGDSLSFNLKDDSEAQQQQERRGGSRGPQFSMDDTATTEDATSENIIIPSLGRVDVRI
ncbi:flagellar hook-length control protein FliK [Nitrospirillum sp. BR 11828]|uniref:flagellar hook-length control protein FliK n=1 Tax=Nitrospirillum sp. BR 11828 TaxID=3104325 RepID=UPI002ACA895F|nr:flagellar hook-length control protein FliK [Nitrospirillum sp. BR 11828]MDZ5647749.1 flagellar hook-length control protein FliK [Nitrospirillum sp. BR 11828]